MLYTDVDVRCLSPCRIIELLILVLELMVDEAESLGLEVKSRTMKSRLPRSLSCIGFLIRSSVQSTHDISRRSAIARAAMQSLDNQI